MTEVIPQKTEELKEGFRLVKMFYLNIPYYPFTQLLIATTTTPGATKVSQ